MYKVTFQPPPPYSFFFFFLFLYFGLVWVKKFTSLTLEIDKVLFTTVSLLDDVNFCHIVT